MIFEKFKMQLSYIQAISKLFDMSSQKFTTLKNFDQFEKQFHDLRFFVAQEVPKLEEQQNFMEKFGILKELLKQVIKHCPDMIELTQCLHICDQYLPKEQRKETRKIEGNQFVLNSPILKTSPQYHADEVQNRQLDVNAIKISPNDPFSRKNNEKQNQDIQISPQYNKQPQQNYQTVKIEEDKNSKIYEAKIKALQIEVSQKNEQKNLIEQQLSASLDQVSLLKSRIMILEAQIITQKKQLENNALKSVENSKQSNKADKNIYYLGAKCQYFIFITLILLLLGFFASFLL